MNEPAVLLENVSRVFRDFWGRPTVRAVDGLSLRADGGEVAGLLGPNGSGKSTTLKLLLGLLRPSAGRVRLFGLPPRDREARRRVGYLPEEPVFHAALTARETLDFYGGLFDLPPEVRRRRTGELLESSGLTDAADRCVGEFSKGMTRRLGIAQALINDPRLLVLDEPTAGLDPLGCRDVKDLIVTLARGGRTVLLSSHLLADVEDVCDRVVVLNAGRVCREGPARALLADRARLQWTLPAGTADADRAARALEAAGVAALARHPPVSLESFFLRVLAEDDPRHAPAAAPRAVPSFLRRGEDARDNAGPAGPPA